MTRLIRKESEGKSFWKRVVDLALTDVRVVAGGLDHDSLEDLEERLLAADFGVPATLRLVGHVESQARAGRVRGAAGLRQALREEMGRIVGAMGGAQLARAASGPTVYLVAGVNGVGKTTSIGKLAHAWIGDGASVLLAAADTYRAGATEQLWLWAKKVGAEFVGGQHGGDPAAVAFDAVDAAIHRKIDFVIVDTAGRLHTQRNLMEELRKIDRVIRRKLEGAPHESLIVLDATVGQNAVAQLRAFKEALDLSGIILAKMDSTARGGIILALWEEFGVPVKLVGTGETVDDLALFDPDGFVEGVFSE